MIATVQEILDSPLQFPDRERADLAASLLESLDQPFAPGSQAAWAEEIQRRLAELDSGTVKPLPWDEARRIIAGRAA